MYMNLENQRVLVTGADGFIGSHLVETLLNRGAHVRALAYYNSFNHWGWLEELKELDNVDVWSGDIRDPHFCYKLCTDIDIVFHLAALITIPYSYKAPASYIDTNVNGTLNMCQAAMENNCKRFIHTSTSEVYGTAQYVPMDEKHPLQPQSPYSASKIGAEAIAMSFFHSYKFPITVARPFNTYGPRQSARAVIPSIIIQIAKGNSALKMGDLRPTRDFNYVLDTCNGFMALAEYEKTLGEIVNIGSGVETSIADLVKKIADLMGREVDIIHDKERVRPKTSEVFRLCCSNEKIKQLTGFVPAYGLEKGLAKTIHWFLNTSHINTYKSDIYNV